MLENNFLLFRPEYIMVQYREHDSLKQKKRSGKERR